MAFSQFSHLIGQESGDRDRSGRKLNCHDFNAKREFFTSFETIETYIIMENITVFLKGEQFNSSNPAF